MDITAVSDGSDSSGSSSDEPEQENRPKSLKRLKEKLNFPLQQAKISKANDSDLDHTCAMVFNRGGNLSSETEKFDTPNAADGQPNLELKNPRRIIQTFGERHYGSSEINPEDRMLELTVLNNNPVPSLPLKNSVTGRADTDLSCHYTISHTSTCKISSSQQPTILRLANAIPALFSQENPRCIFIAIPDQSQRFLLSRLSEGLDPSETISVLQNEAAVLPMLSETTQSPEICTPANQNYLDAATPQIPNTSQSENPTLAFEAEQDDIPERREFSGSKEDLEFALELWRDDLAKILWNGECNKKMSTPDQVSDVGKILVQLAYGIHPDHKNHVEQRRAVFSKLTQKSSATDRTKISRELKNFITEYIKDSCIESLKKPKSGRKGSLSQAERALGDGIAEIIRDANRVTNNKDGRLPGGGRRCYSVDTPSSGSF